MRKEVKRGIVVIILVIIAVISIKLIQNHDAKGKALKKLGYTEEEVTIIKEKLNEEEIEKILNLEKQDKLVSILNEEYYIPYNLFIYLEQAKSDKSIKDIVSIVNVGSYNAWYTNTKEADVTKDITILVNKYNYLNEDFNVEVVPILNWYAYGSNHKTRSEVYEQYKKMWNAANKEGLTLLVNSSFRTYEDQQREYDNSNDDYASKPGFSEHQTGLALDIVTWDTIGNEFEDKQEFTWLQENAYKYGFILRYPKDKEFITGYAYESWHYRYVGVDMATKVKNSGLTYDEYYAYFCEYKKEC